MKLRSVFLFILIFWGGMLAATQMPNEPLPETPIVSKLAPEKEPPKKQSILGKWMQKRIKKKWKKIDDRQMSYFNGLGLVASILTISSTIAILSSGATLGAGIPIIAGIGFVVGTVLAIVSLVQISNYRRRRGIDIRPKALSYLALLPLLGFIALLGAFFNG